MFLPNSSIQPSIVDMFRAPFIAAVIPLVPEASLGTRGLFNQRSAPILQSFDRASSYPTRMVLVAMDLFMWTRLLKVPTAARP